ncbi:reverse transcriptase domain-containing protein [Tanacetum coccineum]
MRTRSSSNLVVESFTIPKRRNRRLSKQIVEPELRSIIETPVATMADTHTISELLQAHTEGYGDAIIIPAILAENFELKVELLSLQVGENLIEHVTRPRLPTALTEIVKELVLMNKATQQATVKAIEETWTYHKEDNKYRPQETRLYRISNQWDTWIIPPPNVQNSQNYNQNQYNQNQGNYQAPNNQEFNQQRGQNFNQGNNHYKAPNYQAPNNQAQVRPSNKLSNYMKSNEATLRAMQTQISNMKLELRNEFKSSFTNQFSSIETKTNKLENQNNQIMNMLTNLTIQRQSPSGSGSLPSNTIANPRGDLKAITTRSGVSYNGPTIPTTSSPLPKEVEREPEATKDKVQNTNLGSTVHVQPPLSKTKGPRRKTDRLANPLVVAKRYLVKVGKFYFLTDFVVVDYDVDPRVPLILGRPFLRTARALIDVHGEELILRNGNEQLIIHADNTSKHPHKHRINFINITCEDCFYKVLKFKKSNHPSSGSTTPFSDSLLEEFADELALLDPFPLGNKDDNFDLEADHKKLNIC